MSARDRSLIVYLTEREIWALAQLVKRITWTEIEANATDRDEAELMRDSLERVRRGLLDVGIDPR